MKGDIFGIDFTEASTWRGIVMVMGACGVPFEPQAAEYFIAAGMGLSGLIGLCFRRRSLTRSPTTDH